MNKLVVLFLTSAVLLFAQDRHPLVMSQTIAEMGKELHAFREMNLPLRRISGKGVKYRLENHEVLVNVLQNSIVLPWNFLRNPRFFLRHQYPSTFNSYRTTVGIEWNSE